MLLDAEFMTKLERLSLVARKAFPGQLKGEKRSPKRGVSVEFADFRNYTPGDDFRYVDKLFLKLFVEEEDLHVYLLLDASESMKFGAPSKADYGKKLVAALGYIALTNLDRLAVWSFSAGLAQPFRMTRGRAMAARLFEFIESIEPGGATSINDALRHFALRTKRSGIVFLVSDFFDPGGYREGLTALLGRGFEVNVIHVLAEDELHPDLAGDLKLVDAETRDAREITVSGSLLASYQRRLNEFCDELQAFCSARAMGYLRTSTSFPFDELVLQYLRRGRLVK
jgi:uncharacterized protein (DUF58 family)